MPARKKTTVPELIENEKTTSSAVIAALRKQLKSAVGEPYQTKANYLHVVMAIDEKNFSMVSELRTFQWRIVTYTVALYVAIAGAVQLVKGTFVSDLYKACLSGGVAVCIVLIYVAAKNMLDKIEEDWRVCREHRKLNDEMNNMTIGIEVLAKRIVTLRERELRRDQDFTYNAEESRKVLTEWLYRSVFGVGIVALAVCGLLIWTAR